MRGAILVSKMRISTMAMRTIKTIDSPGRFTLEEAFEAARSLQRAPAKKTAVPAKTTTRTPVKKTVAAKALK